MRNINWTTEGVFYRARVLTEPGWQELGKWTESDFWEVPADILTEYGRLNRPHESVFYLSTNFDQTLKEIRYNGKNPVVVSRFEVKQPFAGIQIGDPSYDGIATELTSDEKIGGIMFSDFFRDEFSKPVGRGTEFLYRESVVIANTYYSVPFEYSQAYTYPAIDNTLGVFNVAFKNHKAHDFLNYAGSVVFSGYSDHKNMNLRFLFDLF